MYDARTIVRFLAFLVLAVLVGMGFMLKKMADKNGRNPGLARYQERTTNEEAWKAFDTLQQPDFRKVLSYACEWTPPGMDCGRILLPSDELGQVLTTFRSPERKKEAMVDDPVKQWAKSLEVEWNVPLSERLTAQTTLGDVLVVWNQLSKARQDSLARPQTPAPMDPTPVESAPATDPINL
ncbi:MAG TPA: hypothetical protein PKO15_01925 [Fibrobacteria bacterium]|nr:hypothetical protein [Fibrobacteria bacterium]HOX50201.1 hypothetical protein [Fibrobacteria bacterium]